MVGVASDVGLEASSSVSIAAEGLGTNRAVSVGVTAPAWAVRVIATAV